MITSKFFKRGNPVFVGPALTYFKFLEREYFLNADGIAESYETIINYENDIIRLQIVFSLPEAPFVVFQLKSDKRIKKEHRYKPTEKKTNSLIKEYNKYRDSCSFDEWHKKLREGDFNQLIDDILFNLSSELRNKAPWIEFVQNSLLPPD
jgi:hypothetical protein